MKNLKLLSLTLFLSMGLLFVSCSGDDDNGPVNPTEEINIVKVSLTPVAGGETVTFEYGTAGADFIQMTNDVWYNMSLKFFNGTEDITPEIMNELDDHFVVFQYSGDSDMSLLRTSVDDQSGMMTEIKGVGTSTNGEFRIILKHRPSNTNPDAHNNFGATTGGSTDADVTFTVNVNPAT